MKQRTLCFITILAAASGLYAQEASKQWSLQDCINYALEKNIKLQQDKIALEESDVDVKTAKASLFPSLSFNTGHNVINRPYQQNSSTVSGTEIISSDNKTTYNGNYSLSAQWTLWNGGKRLNNIKQQKTARDIASLSVSETENMLQEEITKLFVQILYADESVKINKSTLETSEANFKRGEELFKEGSISKADLAQLESQVGNDKYQLVTSESTLRNYKLQLKQLLELDGTDEMTLALPTLSDEQVMKVLPSQADVYQTALTTRPEIQSGQLSIDNAKLGIKTAKAGYMPTISLSASSSSTTNSASTNNWAQQMKYGWNNMIGVSLSIPIFDNRQTKTAVNKACIQQQQILLDMKNQQTELYSTIENYWLQANTNQSQYQAAKVSRESAQQSYDLLSEQFRLGLKNIVELRTGKDNLMRAKQNELQAKYLAILNIDMLRFYQEGRIM